MNPTVLLQLICDLQEQIMVLRQSNVALTNAAAAAKKELDAKDAAA